MVAAGVSPRRVCDVRASPEGATETGLLNEDAGEPFMQYVVRKEHRSEYPDPIVLARGDAVVVGERDTGPDAWEGWIWCTSLRTGKAGWVPEQLIRHTGNAATVTEDYSAFELSVDPEDRLTGLRELNGWLWCRHETTGECGWVPGNVLEQVADGELG